MRKSLLPFAYLICFGYGHTVRNSLAEEDYKSQTFASSAHNLQSLTSLLLVPTRNHCPPKSLATLALALSHPTRWQGIARSCTHGKVSMQVADIVDAEVMRKAAEQLYQTSPPLSKDTTDLLLAAPGLALVIAGFAQMLGIGKLTVIDKAHALPGRKIKNVVRSRHLVLRNPMEGPWPESMQTMVLASGCFWGAEKGFWRLPGIYSTAVGYAAGFTRNPTHEEVKTERTGATEAVQVVFDPEKISVVDILRWFWESHDPTQGMAQGNDVGTRYRSGLYFFDDEQKGLFEASKIAYERALNQHSLDLWNKAMVSTDMKEYDRAGEAARGKITTEISAASDFGNIFYYAADYHQQYLAKPGNRQYCSARPQQVSLPPYKTWVPKSWGP